MIKMQYDNYKTYITCWPHVGRFQNNWVFEIWFNVSKVIEYRKIPLFTLFLWRNGSDRHNSTLNNF